MKFSAMILLLLSLSVEAQSLRPLKDVMTNLGNSLKVVTLAVQAGTITPTIIQEADNVVKYTIESEAITPDTVLSLPRIDQEAAQAKYNQEMKELEKMAVDLSNAIKIGNLNSAKQVLLLMGANKKQGHKDFK